MSQNFLRKFRYKFKRKIIFNLHERMRQFEQIEFEDKEKYYEWMKKSEKLLATFDVTKEMLAKPLSYLLFFTVALFAIVVHFYLSFQFGVNKPIVTALIYIIPSLFFSMLIYLAVGYGKLRHIENFTNLPLEDKISNALKWVFVSAIISGISTTFFPALLIYLILTPLIVGIGAAILFLIYEILVTYVLNYFWSKFYKKHPLPTIVDMFMQIFEELNDKRLAGYYYKMSLAQLLGDTGEVMQRVLPQHFSRMDESLSVLEITDPYVVKLIERRVMEIAMSMKLYAKLILFGDDTKINYVKKKLTKNFIAILKDDGWKTYETENSDEITMLINLPPLSKQISKTLDKLRFVAVGLLPAGALLLIQNTAYALPSAVVESVLPFIVTWAFVSILNLLGSDDIVDRALKAKSIAGSFGNP